MSNDYQVNANPNGERSYVVTLLLAFFLGFLGVHRFYTGYIMIGVVQLLTLGGCGIWTLIDLISVALNKYKDADGKDLANHNPGCGLIVLIVVGVTFLLGGLSSVFSMLTMFG